MINDKNVEILSGEELDMISDKVIDRINFLEDKCKCSVSEYRKEEKQIINSEENRPNNISEHLDKLFNMTDANCRELVLLYYLVETMRDYLDVPPADDTPLDDD